MKAEKTLILNEVVNTTGLTRSSGRPLLNGPALPEPKDQFDRRRLRPKTYSDASRRWLERLWALMGAPCGKNMAIMLPLWLPGLGAAGKLAGLEESVRDELLGMSPATIDRYLAPARVRT